jgi:hypothetical protein
MFNEFSERAFGFRLITVLTGLATCLHLGKHPVDGAATRSSLIDFELVSQLVEVFSVHNFLDSTAKDWMRAAARRGA